METRRAKIGDTVNVDYTGKFEDGTVFDTSKKEGRSPINVTLGNGQVIKGFENALIDMVIGSSKIVSIGPEEGYGDYRPDAVIDIPKDRIPQEVEVGQQLQASGPQGPFLVTVVEIGENTVKLDHNHPLAGKTLIFELEIANFVDEENPS